MEHGIELAEIPPAEYATYKLEVIFKAFKWDPQVEDHNTVSRQVLLLEQATAKQLANWAEALSAETMAMEEELVAHPRLAKEMGLPKQIVKQMPALKKYKREGHIRLMRYDFHPTETGWAVSEVNSDVPGGYAEASVLPRLAARYFEGCNPAENLTGHVLVALQKRVRPGGSVALVHATSYSDDSQIMQFMAAELEKQGFAARLAAPDHIRWQNGKAVWLEQGNEGGVDAVIRYFPVEWLLELPRKARWNGAFGAETPSCNHPVVILTQSKRLPLVWDRLQADVGTWKMLLPETKDPKALKGMKEGWIYKPALGRVGQGIGIAEAMSAKELRKIERLARRHPKGWVAQRRFASQPYPNMKGEKHHLCVGVFTVDGKFAGFYARMSPYARIDEKAKDIPVLVKGEWNHV